MVHLDHLEDERGDDRREDRLAAAEGEHGQQDDRVEVPEGPVGGPAGRLGHPGDQDATHGRDAGRDARRRRAGSRRVLVPCASSASGESDMPRSSRPSRLRRRPITTAAHNAGNDERDEVVRPVRRGVDAEQMRPRDVDEVGLTEHEERRIDQVLQQQAEPECGHGEIDAARAGTKGWRRAPGGDGDQDRPRPGRPATASPRPGRGRTSTPRRRQRPSGRARSAPTSTAAARARPARRRTRCPSCTG